MDAASSFRIAGQWAMLLDGRRAIELLTGSALIWHQLGYGFGTFLLAAIAPAQLNRRDLIGRLNQVAQQYASPIVADRISDEGQRPLEPLLHPQQQAYALLAGAGMQQRLELPIDLLRVIGDRSPHKRGVAPIGALGTPLRVYWDIANHFLRNDDSETAALVANDLAGIAVTYAQTIGSAMANERLWFNAAAPVDVCDVDIVGIAMTAARRLGPDLMQLQLRSVMENLEATARVPLECADEMIDLDNSNEAGDAEY
jgi:hypothetical protein